MVDGAKISMKVVRVQDAKALLIVSQSPNRNVNAEIGPNHMISRLVNGIPPGPLITVVLLAVLVLRLRAISMLKTSSTTTVITIFRAEAVLKFIVPILNATDSTNHWCSTSAIPVHAIRIRNGAAITIPIATKLDPTSMENLIAPHQRMDCGIRTRYI